MKTLPCIIRCSFVSVFIVFFLASPGFSQSSLNESSSHEVGDLIWSDEFEGTEVPDTTKWERLEYNRRKNVDGPDGWWSNEDSFLDGKGNLVITLRRIENKNDDQDSCDFSVGMVRSKDLFEQLYGKFEIRCKLPTQPGWWVAFWMMQGDVGSEENGGVDGTEVDIMEAFGWTNRMQHAFHWDGYKDAHKHLGATRYPADIKEGFHTYSMEWYPEMYVFFIDGEESWRSEGGGVCNQPGYIKISGEMSTLPWAISSDWCNHPKDGVYPDSFVIDYVRVYEIGEYQSPAGITGKPATQEVRVFPNPVSDQLTLHWDPNLFEKLSAVTISNSVGKVLKSITRVENHTRIPMGDLPAGIYFLSINKGKTTEFRKIIVN